MKAVKKLCCLTLCCALLLGVCVTAGAADFTDSDQIVHTEAVDTLVELKIMDGKEDGTYFDPSGTVTRAELCKMICLILNGGKAPELNASAFSFSDTEDSWASGYIEYCANLGFAAGCGDGTFDPEGAVTATQAAKMLLGAIGFDASIEEFTGKGWALRVNVRANQKNFFDNLDLDPSAPLSRDAAAQMIYNALNAVVVRYDYMLTQGADGELQAVPVPSDNENGDTLLSEKFDVTP